MFYARIISMVFYFGVSVKYVSIFTNKILCDKDTRIFFVITLVKTFVSQDIFKVY